MPRFVAALACSATTTYEGSPAKGAMRRAPDIPEQAPKSHHATFQGQRGPIDAARRGPYARRRSQLEVDIWVPIYRKYQYMGSNTSQNAATQRALDALRRVVQALRESSRIAERRFGLSGAQLFVLQKLAESSAISLNDLARLTHTHQSSVSAVVTRLVEKGLVRRLRSERDARMLKLTLTAAGARLARRSPDVAQQRLAQAIQLLPPGRLKELASALTDIAKAVGGGARVPTMFFEDRSPRNRRKPNRPRSGHSK